MLIFDQFIRASADQLKSLVEDLIGHLINKPVGLWSLLYYNGDLLYQIQICLFLLNSGQLNYCMS